MSSSTCQHCGCSEIDTDPARGDAVCTNCGSVLEDNIIVSEVQFEENSHGGSRAIGQLVSAEGHSSGGLNLGYQRGLGKESRMITLHNAKRKIIQVAEQLRLNQHCVETAYNFYKMALARHLTRGRRNSHVIAACVYMVCRTEGTPHMLLDLSDIVQVNVHDLGKTYLRLSCALCINVPTIDPCLYIVRFAHRLEFGDKTHEVSMTALRLVQRMKRDWMHMGRRPSGLCGAALLVAARLHDFNRTVKDIIKIVRVCEATLRKRLIEFGDTPSSRLTLDEFMNIDLEEEQDPPCFKAARKKQKLQQMEEHKVEEATIRISKLQKLIEKALDSQKKKLHGRYAKHALFTPEEESSGPSESTMVEQFIVDETVESIEEFLDGCHKPNGKSPSSQEVLNSILLPCGSPAAISTASQDHQMLSRLGPGPTAASLGLKDSIEECMQIKENPEDEVEGGELDLTGLDDKELDSYIMTDEEVRMKTDLWTETNYEYLQELKEKEERKAKELEENANKPEQKKRRRQSKKRIPIQANSAGEAIEKMLQEKKISNKINYDVLKNLNSMDSKPVIASPEKEAKPDTQDVFLMPRRKTPRTQVSVGGTPPAKISSLITSIINARNKQSSQSQDEDKVVEEMPINPISSPDTAATTKHEPTEESNIEEGAQEDQEYDEDVEDEECEEDDVCLSAAQLLGQHRGEGVEEDYYDDQEDYVD